MSVINTDVWGTESNWVNIVTYNQSATDNDKAKWLSYNGSDTTLYDYLHSDRVTENEDIDNSISYCGLGTASPYNNLIFYRGVEAYSYRFRENNIPWVHYNENSQEDIVVQTNEVTNFGLGHSDQWAQTAHMNCVPIMYKNNPQYDRFYNGWKPDSLIDTIGYNTGYYDANRILHTQYIGKIPVKNIVCVPTVIAFNNLNSDNPTYIASDLKTYISSTGTNNYSHYPYVASVIMQLYTDINGASHTPHTRTTPLNINNLSILNELDIFKGMPGNYVQPDNANYIMETSALFYGGIWGSSVPIFGRLTNVSTTNNIANCRYNNADIQSDNEGNWDMFNINYDNWELSSTGPIVYIWAGETPSEYIYNPTDRESCRRYLYKEVTVDNVEEFHEMIRKAVACFGLFFVDGIEDVNLDLDNEDMMLGILEKGIGNGKYSFGTDNRNQDQWNWNDMHENTYNPDDPLDKKERPYNESAHKLSATTHAYGGNFYFDSDDSKLSSLLAEINGLTVPSGGWKEDNRFYGQEPLSCIIESRLLFIKNPYTDGTTAVRLGDYQAQNVNMILKLTTSVIEYEYPSINVPFYYNDFRDLSPYTTMTLYIPFCGTIDLDPNIVTGHNVNIVEYIEPITGDIKCVVKIDRSEYYTLKGNCACDLSISGYNMSQYAQSRAMLQMQMITASFNAVSATAGGLSGASIASTFGNVPGALLQGLGGITNAFKDINMVDTYDKMNKKLKPSVGRADRASSNVEEGAAYRPYITITRPCLLKEYEQIYGNSLLASGYIYQNGIATHTIARIGDHYGCIKCENPHVDIPCTPEEAKMIKQSLEKGIRIV